MPDYGLVPIPATGEVVDLAGPSNELAGAFDQLKQLEQQLREVRNRISDELLHRMDGAAEWTIHTENFKVTGSSPELKEEWDEKKLRALLEAMVREGTVSTVAAQKAIKTEVTYKPVVAGLKALRKTLKPDDVARLEECRELVPPRRSIRVEFER